MSRSCKLCAGDCRLEFDEVVHGYTLDKQPIIGVSKTLQVVGIIDPAVYTPGSAERGKAVHAACEYWDRGYLDESSIHPLVKPRLDAYREFVSRTGPLWSEIEAPVHHRTYAGTLDRVGSAVLVDIKTSQQAQPWWGLQLAAYASAYEAMTGVKIKERLALRLLDDGTFRIDPYRDPTDYVTWHNCVGVALWKRSKSPSV